MVWKFFRIFTKFSVYKGTSFLHYYAELNLVFSLFFVLPFSPSSRNFFPKRQEERMPNSISKPRRCTHRDSYLGDVYAVLCTKRQASRCILRDAIEKFARHRCILRGKKERWKLQSSKRGVKTHSPAKKYFHKFINSLQKLFNKIIYLG